jgi:transcriptional regulator with XRE-family HTH domain
LRSRHGGYTLSVMLIGERLRELRESKNLSQGEVEKRTGLLRCYTSRVENGHTVPSIETLEKYARALEVPMYKLFLDGDGQPQKPKLPASKAESTWGANENERRELRAFAKALSRLDERQRSLMMAMAQTMARRKGTK